MAALVAMPPQYDSPTSQPFTITLSPGDHDGSSLRATVPAKSMPGTIGQVRTIGTPLTTARPSL